MGNRLENPRFTQFIIVDEWEQRPDGDLDFDRRTLMECAYQQTARLAEEEES